MYRNKKSAFLCASLLTTLLGSTLLSTQSAHAQLLSTDVAPGQDATNTPLYTADRVLDDIGKSVGATVYADTYTSTIRVLEPKEKTTVGNFRQHLTDVVSQLPGGSQLAKLYLPAPPAGRTWSGDDVAAYAAGATRLYGSLSASNPAGTVQILTQQVPIDKAKDYMAQLHLKVVYVVFNTNVSATPTVNANMNQYSRTGNGQFGQNGQNQNQTRGRGNNPMRNMTPQQRQQLQNMTPQQRTQWMQQYRNTQTGQYGQ